MPRKSQIDAPGALHHVIARGFNRQRIFLDEQDKKNFIERFSTLLNGSGTKCYAWAALDNHFQLLLRTGTVSISTLMRRFLTGYAVVAVLGLVAAADLQVLFGQGPGLKERP